jgi:hypothetical protein
MSEQVLLQTRRFTEALICCQHSTCSQQTTCCMLHVRPLHHCRATTYQNSRWWRLATCYKLWLMMPQSPPVCQVLDMCDNIAPTVPVTLRIQHGAVRSQISGHPVDAAADVSVCVRPCRATQCNLQMCRCSQLTTSACSSPTLSLGWAAAATSACLHLYQVPMPPAAWRASLLLPATLLAALGAAPVGLAG